MSEVIGTRYASEAVNVRALPSATSAKLDTLSRGAKVRVTDVTSKGFRQIMWNGKPAYVSADFLIKSQPSTAKVPGDSAQAPGNASSPAASAPGACSAAHPKGVNANGMAVYRAVCARWPQVRSYGGYRPTSDMHGQGRAVDVMISGPVGWEIANYLRENARALRIQYIIFDQKIWNIARDREGWRWMSNRGSDTANHRDHVHITTVGL